MFLVTLIKCILLHWIMLQHACHNAVMSYTTLSIRNARNVVLQYLFWQMLNPLCIYSRVDKNHDLFFNLIFMIFLMSRGWPPNK